MKNESEISVNEALAELSSARGRMFATGAADAELGVITALEKKVYSGEISPQDAVARVHSMINARSSYH